MKQQENNNLSKPLVISCIVLIIAVVLLGFQSIDDKSKIDLYENLLLLGNEDTTLLISGDSHYEYASLAYERQNYNEVVKECELARKDWLSYTQLLRESKEEVFDYKEPIFDIYSDMLSSEIKIYTNMYEACEHFESAARYYDLYYNTDVSYDDVSFDMGGKAIDLMNDKIEAHDVQIEVYNTLLAKYDKELKKIIK